jgi:hypothetical protein
MYSYEINYPSESEERIGEGGDSLRLTLEDGTRGKVADPIPVSNCLKNG